MKKILITAFLTIAFGAWASEPAIDFVKNLTDDVIENVIEKKMPEDKKLEKFRVAFDQALDEKSIGQFVLGRYWKGLSPTQQTEFLDVFTNFITKSWAQKFAMYNGQKITFKDVKTAPNHQYYVNSVITNNPPVVVVWRVREKQQEYKIIDIIVEGVSMAMSYRNEYASFLQKNGGDVAALMTELKNKADTLTLKKGK